MERKRAFTLAVSALAIALTSSPHVYAADSGSVDQPEIIPVETEGSPATLDPQKRRELETAIWAIVANLFWAPLEHDSASRARAEHEAALNVLLKGKSPDEIIAIARRSADGESEFAKRQGVLERFSMLSALPNVLEMERLIIQEFKRKRTGEVDFVRYPNWEQFTNPTDDAGEPSPTARNKPYHRSAPRNLLNEKTKVLVLEGPISKAGPVTDGEAGWVYCNGELYLVGPDGVPSSPNRLASLAERAKSELPPRMRLILDEEATVQAARLHGLSVLRAYKLARGRYPDFDRYPAWEQMTHPTNAKADVDESGEYRPILSQAPANPLRQVAGVLEVKQLPAEPIKDDRIGWLLTRNAKGEADLTPLDESGRIYQPLRLNGY